MTQIISAVSYTGVQQLTDRLLSYDGKPWDRAANKNVLLFTGDAVVSMAFTGTAFISQRRGGEKIPTDQWIVEACTGEPIPRVHGELVMRLSGPGAPPSVDLNLTLSRLCDAVNAAFSNGSVDRQVREEPFTIVIAGWRWNKKHSRPFLCRVWRENPSEAFRIVWEPRDRWRRPVIGVDPLHTRQHIDKERLGAGFACCACAEDITDVLADALRQTATRLTNNVGADLMSIRLPPASERHVCIEYLPLNDDVVPHGRWLLRPAYTPWIVAPHYFSPPLEIVNSFALECAGWRIDLIGRLTHGFSGFNTHPRRLLG